MKAMMVHEVGDPSVLQLQDVPMPEIAPHQVLVKVEAASVNFADIKARKGQYHGVESGASFTPGLDCAGVVVETGSDVTHFRVGDRVMAFPKGGSYAEYAKADEVLTFAVPDELSLETAAASLTVGVTAYNVLRKMARLEAGETILIHAAAGGIGSTAIQLARIFGAGKIIGTVGSSEKIASAKEFGADDVINYRTQDFAAIVNDMTDGKGVDVILDTIGGQNFDHSLNCLARFGRIVSIGHVNEGSMPGHVKTTELHSNCRSVIGYSTGTYLQERPEFLHEAAREVTKLMLEGKLEIIISKRYPLAAASKAHAYIESRKSVGKVLLIP